MVTTTNTTGTIKGIGKKLFNNGVLFEQLSMSLQGASIVTSTMLASKTLQQYNDIVHGNVPIPKEYSEYVNGLKTAEERVYKVSEFAVYLEFLAGERYTGMDLVRRVYYGMPANSGISPSI